jgi:hypothetical protein
MTVKSWNENIEKLKREIDACVETLKFDDTWLQFEKLYRALGAIEDLACTRKTTLEELLDLPPSTESEVAINAEEHSQLALGDQQEQQIISEIEKGS